MPFPVGVAELRKCKVGAHSCHVSTVWQETVSGVHPCYGVPSMCLAHCPGNTVVEDVDNEKLELSSGWGDRPWETSGTRMSHGDVYDGEKLSRGGEEGVNGRL